MLALKFNMMQCTEYSYDIALDIILMAITITTAVVYKACREMFFSREADFNVAIWCIAK